MERDPSPPSDWLPPRDFERELLTALDRPHGEWPAARRELESGWPGRRASIDAAFRAAARSRSVGFAAESGEPVRVRAGDRLGDFTLLEEVGRGGMGCVFRARQQHPERIVALKIPHRGDDEWLLGRQQREAQAVARLGHPGIVPLLQAGSDAGVSYLAFEYVEGRTIAAIVVALDGKVPRDGAAMGRAEAPYDRAVAELACELLDAVQCAHEHGVVHRDLKPGNLMLDRTGRLRVLDFGLARVSGEETLTAGHEMLGTPQYMAPEQIEDARATGAWTDVYAVGVIVHELLTLRRPFGYGATSAVLQRIRQGDCTPVHVSRRGVARDLSAIVEKAMALEPSRRYPSAAAFRDDLQCWLRGQPVAARSTPRVVRWWRRLRRRPDLLATAAAASMAVGSLVVWDSVAAADRQAVARREVLARLDDLARLQAQGRWDDALHVVDGLLQGDGLERAEREKLQGEATTVRANAERASLAAELTRIRDEAARQSVNGVMSWSECVSDLHALLGRLGIRLRSDTETADAAAARAHQSPLLIEALDELLLVSIRAGRPVGDVAAVVRLADAVDGREASRKYRDAAMRVERQTLNGLAADADIGSLSSALIELCADRLGPSAGEAASTVFARACAAKPEDFWLHVGRATALRERKEEPVQQTTSYWSALLLRPDAAFAWSNLGTVYLDRSDPEMALWCYEQAIRLAPRFPDYHAHRAIALERLQRITDAIMEHERALDLMDEAAPERGDELSDIGRLTAQGGDLAAAMPYMERAVALAPQHPVVVANAAYCALQLGRHADAARYWHLLSETEAGRAAPAGQFRIPAAEAALEAAAGDPALSADERDRCVAWAVAWLERECQLHQASDSPAALSAMVDRICDGVLAKALADPGEPRSLLQPQHRKTLGALRDRLQAVKARPH